jgi:hypothetical protein
MSWRRLGQVLLGLALGAICLVMWSSSSASALDAPSGDPAPPTLADHLAGLVEQVTSPVDRALEPLGVEVAPIVEPLNDQVVAPTLDAVAATAQELTDRLPRPSAIPGDPGLPDLPVRPDPATPGTVTTSEGMSSSLASHDAQPGAGAGVGPSPSPEGTRVDGRAGPPSPGVAHLSVDPASAEDGPSPRPALPAPAPLVQAVLGALTSSGQSATGLVLLAVLAGGVALLGAPPGRRVALPVAPALRARAAVVLTPPG